MTRKLSKIIASNPKGLVFKEILEAFMLLIVAKPINNTGAVILISRSLEMLFTLKIVRFVKLPSIKAWI